MSAERNYRQMGLMQRLRETYRVEIHTAVHNDIAFDSWTYLQASANCGIRCFVTGVNTVIG